jgi:uncharacterized membrane protein
VVAGIAIMVGGIALIVFGALGRAGRLTRQSIVGLRTKVTLASDEAWRAAHEAAANWVVGAGAILFVGGLLVMLLDSETTGDVVALIATASMLLPLVIAFRRGQAAAQSVLLDRQIRPNRFRCREAAVEDSPVFSTLGGRSRHAYVPKWAA